MKELHRQRSQRLDSVRRMERCVKVEDLVVLSSRGYRSIVFFGDSIIVTLNIGDNLDAALGAVSTQ